MQSIHTDSRRRPLLRAAGAFLIVLAAGCGQAPESPPAESAQAPAVESAAPEAAKTVAVVSPTDLAARMAEAKGKVLVVNYWATWCPPCVHELPEFAAFYNAMDRSQVDFLSVSTDHPSTVAEVVTPFVKERALPFPVHVFDGMPDDLSSAVDVGDWTSAVPATFVYDRDGKLVKAWNEEVTRAIVEAAVTAAGGDAA